LRPLSATLAAVALAAAAACGSDATEAGPKAPAAGAGYTTVSDVTAHAAIGADAAKIRELLAPAKDGGTVDWAAVSAVFTKGGASKKGDGSFRTLGALAEGHPATDVVTKALAGGASDAVRAQAVDKGITVILADKVVGELAAAAEKVAAKELDPKDGAPHNVDEAWAFFTAQDQGPALTADKRAKDFSLAGKVREPILAALTAAQSAAAAGDAAALERATLDVRAGLDYVFYLATHKYLDHGGDAVKQAEGAAFYLGIADRVRTTAPAADKAIAAAFAGGDTAAGRAALHEPAVLQALRIPAAGRVDKS
jgi:hypothetical protein